MSYRVTIRRNADGVERVIEHPEDWDDEVSDFIWSEGNYARDCNRASFFAEAGGESSPDIPCTCGQTPAKCTCPRLNLCGDTRFTISFIELSDGRRVEIDKR